MKDLIGWLLLILSCLGGLYAIGLFISYFVIPDDLNDDIECDCYRCER